MSGTQHSLQLIYKGPELEEFLIGNLHWHFEMKRPTVNLFRTFLAEKKRTKTKLVQLIRKSKNWC